MAELKQIQFNGVVYDIVDEQAVHVSDVDTQLSPSSTNPVQNKAVYEAINNVQNAIDDVFHKEAIGSWTPDFNGLKVLNTYEFDIAATTAYVICERPNVTDIDDATDVLAFRITVTGTGIKSVSDIVIRLQPTVNITPRVVMNQQSRSTSAATTGYRYFYSVYPKAANTNYKYQFAIAAYNNTARHVKVEVFKTTSDWTFMNAATAYSYNSSYQTRNDLTVYGNLGLIANYTQYATANYANYSGYVSSWGGLLNGSYSFLKTGAAIAANQLCFIGEDGKVYPTTSTSVAVDPCWPIFYTTSAVANNTAISWSYLREWGVCTVATTILRDTLAANKTTYLKCTYSSGKIYSANRMTQTVEAGNVYFKLGISYSATIISFNTRNSDYFAIDSSGNYNILHGKNIVAASATTAGSVSKSGNISAGTYGVLFDNVPITTVGITTTTPSVNAGLTFTPSTGTLSATSFSGSGAGLTNIPLSSIQGSDELLLTKLLHLYHDLDLDTYEFTDSLTEAEIYDILDAAFDGEINLNIQLTDTDTTELLKYYYTFNLFFLKVFIFETTPVSGIDQTTWTNNALPSYLALLYARGGEPPFQFQAIEGANLATLSQQLMQLLAAKEDLSNKVTSISSSSTDDEYPSAKCVYDEITNISASHITSGTIASDRLPTADPDTKGALKTVFKNGGLGVQLPLITNYNDGGITIQEYPGSSTNSTCYGLAQTGGIGYTKIPNFTGATSSAAGATGLVPAPSSGDQNKFLRANGQWETTLPISVANDTTDEMLYFSATNGTNEYYLDKDSNNNNNIGPRYNVATKTTYVSSGFALGPNTHMGIITNRLYSLNSYPYAGFNIITPIEVDQNGAPTSAMAISSSFEMMMRVHGCVFINTTQSEDYDAFINLSYNSTTGKFGLKVRSVGKRRVDALLANYSYLGNRVCIMIGDVSEEDYNNKVFLKDATFANIICDVLGINTDDFNAGSYTNFSKLMMPASKWGLSSIIAAGTYAEFLAHYCDRISETTIHESTDFSGNLDLTDGDLWVNGNIEAEGNIYAPTMSTDSLNVDGAAYIDGGLGITGTLTVNNQNLGQVLNYDNILHGSCSSAASSASKAITLYGSQTADDIKPGTRLQVYFSNVNGMPSSGTMTLNIGNNSYAVWVMDKAANAVNSIAQVGPFFKHQRFLTFYISGDNPSRAYIIPNTDVYLKSPYQKEIRPTSMNVTTQAGAYLQYLCATNACTTGKPSINGSVTDAAVLHFNWDNSNLYSAQLAIQSGNATLHGMAYRNQDGTTENSWNAWKTLVDEDNIASYLPSTVELNTNRVTSISSSSTDSEYPTAKCVYDAIAASGGTYGIFTTSANGLVPMASLANGAPASSNDRDLFALGANARWVQFNVMSQGTAGATGMYNLLGTTASSATNTGTGTFTNQITFNGVGDLNVGGDLDVGGDVDITGDVDVTGDLSAASLSSSGLTVAGNLYLKNPGGTSDWTNPEKLVLVGASNKEFSFKVNNNGNNVDVGWDWDTGAGSGLGLRGSNYSSPGQFFLYARNSTTGYAGLAGDANGVLKWNNRRVLTATDATQIGSASQPVYINSSGYATAGNTIPTVTLNGAATTSASFYAPTGAGTSGQLLQSSGTGAPTWTTVTIPAAPGTLNTTATTAQSTSASEALSGSITLHKIAKTGTYSDLIDAPSLVASISSSSTDAQVPSAKCVYDSITGLSGSYITSGTVSSDRLPSASDSTKGVLKSTFKNITLGGVTFPTFTQIDDSSITIPEYPAGSGTAYGLAINSYTAYTKIPDLTGASSSAAGVAGLVPAPASGDQDKFLKGDGTWATVSGGGGGAGDDCYYGYCSASATTPKKTVTISNSGYTITDHVRLFVYFANAHTYSSSKPYLSIDDVTYQIRYYDLNISAEDTTSMINNILYNKRYMEFYFLTMSGSLVAIALPDAIPTLFSPYRTSNTRITNLNALSTTDGAYMKYVVASSNVTTGKPVINGAQRDAMVLHFNWDNSAAYAVQLAIQDGSSSVQGGIAYRRQNGQTNGWYDWKTVIDEDNISSYLSNTLEYVTNKVTSITSSSTDTQYPSAKAVYDTFWPYNSTTFAKMIRAGGIYVCETAANTAAKVVTKEGQSGFSLVINSTNNTTDPANEDATSVTTYEHGTRISVIFENANTAQSPTLQLSSAQGATAFPIYVYDKTDQDYFRDYDGEYPLEGLVEFMFIDCDVGQTTFQGWLLLPPVQVSSIKIGSTVVTPSATGQVDLTTAINSLIDAKIAAITNADTTSY